MQVPPHHFALTAAFHGLGQGYHSRTWSPRGLRTKPVLMLTCLPAAPQPQQPVPTGARRRQRGPCGSSLPGVSQGFAVPGRGSGSFACCAGDVGFGLRMEKIPSWKLSHLLERVILTHYQLLGWGSSSAPLCLADVVEGFSASFPIPQIPLPPQTQSHQRGRSHPCLVSPVPLHLEGHPDSWAAMSPRPVPYTAPAHSLCLTPWQPPHLPALWHLLWGWGPRQMLCPWTWSLPEAWPLGAQHPPAQLRLLNPVTRTHLVLRCLALGGRDRKGPAGPTHQGAPPAKGIPSKRGRGDQDSFLPSLPPQMLTELLQRGGHEPGPGRK